MLVLFLASRDPSARRELLVFPRRPDRCLQRNSRLDGSPPRSLPPMSLISATQLTAVATAVLALVTAFYVRQALSASSRRRSATMRHCWSSPSFPEQRKINELQAEDLRESLNERDASGRSPNANRPTRWSSA